MTDNSSLLLFLTDSPNGTVSQDLDILYPGRVEKRNLVAEPHGVDVLRPYPHVLTMVHSGENLEHLDYGAVTEYALGGGQVISCLFEYAQNRGLQFSKTHIGPTALRDSSFTSRSGCLTTNRPALRIEVENDVTRGYTVGDEVWWYGAVSSAPETLYENQMVQRQVMGVRESEATTILATSNLNGGAVMLEEKIGSGRILAMDLLSPGRPFFNSHGSTNKYLFLGNVVGQSVRYGKHYPQRLSYDEFMVAMHELALRYPEVSLQAEGPCSDGREMWSFGLGDAANPTMYFGAAVHGWEWENAFGLLRLTEILCENPQVEGLNTRQLHFRIVPIQNPWGYDHFTRQNTRGVDLNRNFDCSWEELHDVQDVMVPWDYNYKGARSASEQETQALQRIIDRTRPRCVIDFHTADYVLHRPHRGNAALLTAIHEEIQTRLKDRYLCQAPYNGPYQQVNMDRATDFTNPQPYLIDYAAKQGVPAAFVIEMSGNRDDVHALVMNTDTVVEICLAAVKQCLQWQEG